MKKLRILARIFFYGVIPYFLIYNPEILEDLLPAPLKAYRPDGDYDCVYVWFIYVPVTLIFLFVDLLLRKWETKYRLYANLVRNGVRRVDDIVAATGLRYDVVKKDLRKFAKKGKGDFQGVYFNEATQEICLASPVAPAARWNNAPANAPATWNNAPANAPATWNNAPANAPAQPVAPRNVVCSACGASVTLVGDKRVCEYCGTPLN